MLRTDRKLQTDRKTDKKNIQRYYMVVDNHEEYGGESHQEMIWERQKMGLVCICTEIKKRCPVTFITYSNPKFGVKKCDTVGARKKLAKASVALTKSCH